MNLQLYYCTSPPLAYLDLHSLTILKGLCHASLWCFFTPHTSLTMSLFTLSIYLILAMTHKLSVFTALIFYLCGYRKTMVSLPYIRVRTNAPSWKLLAFFILKYFIVFRAISAPPIFLSGMTVLSALALPLAPNHWNSWTTFNSSPFSLI